MYGKKVAINTKIAIFKFKYANKFALIYNMNKEHTIEPICHSIIQFMKDTCLIKKIPYIGMDEVNNFYIKS